MSNKDEKPPRQLPETGCRDKDRRETAHRRDNGQMGSDGHVGCDGPNPHTNPRRPQRDHVRTVWHAYEGVDAHQIAPSQSHPEPPPSRLVPYGRSWERGEGVPVDVWNGDTVGIPLNVWVGDTVGNLRLLDDYKTVNNCETVSSARHLW